MEDCYYPRFNWLVAVQKSICRQSLFVKGEIEKMIYWEVHEEVHCSFLLFSDITDLYDRDRGWLCNEGK